MPHPDTTPDYLPSTIRITISNYLFQVSAPYSAGPTTLTEEEARAFNTLRAENIRNRMASKVRHAIESSPSGELTPQTLADLQSQISSLDATYQFPVRQRLAKVTAIDVEIEVVAREMADSAARESGLHNIYATDAMVEQWKRSPEVQAEARRRLTEQKEILKEEEL